MTVRRLLGLLVAMTFLIAACGSDSDTVVSQDAGDTGNGDADTGSVELPDGTDVEFGFDAENCEQLTSAFENDPFGDAFANGDDPTEGLATAAAYLDSIVDDVPEEIAADIQTLADTYGRLATASADVDWEAIASGDSGAVFEATQLATAFGDGSFVQAAANLATFTAENCAGGPG
ncbi:MAG TPA: hypothetical protein VMW08_19730 [Acidimicrobiales bacterium]|nr:hypothetical protein [Acidimicrobiales bacterium]